MDIENESTFDSEDETDSCTLQYERVDDSLLSTAVFIKFVDFDPGESVLMHVCAEDTKEDSRSYVSFQSILIGGMLFLASMIIFRSFKS